MGLHQVAAVVFFSGRWAGGEVAGSLWTLVTAAALPSLASVWGTVRCQIKLGILHTYLQTHTLKLVTCVTDARTIQ